MRISQIEREVESFIGLKHSVFKNEDHLPGLGLDLGGYTTEDVFKVCTTLYTQVQCGIGTKVTKII